MRTVDYDGKRLTYASDAEMAVAIADLERRIVAATAQVSVVRVASSKGV